MLSQTLDVSAMQKANSMANGAAAAHEALVAFQRFGLGAKPGGPRRIGENARAALLRELMEPTAALISTRALPDYRTACAISQSGADPTELFLQERRARMQQALKPEIGLLERLVMFWGNHFSMSVNKNWSIRGTIGQLERDVIRPNILGSFVDMLLGVMRHPAMIGYLDNAYSIGTNSAHGRSRRIGHNENLAREALELHTLGAGGGYTQGDVTALALILTGWSLVTTWEADNNLYGGSDANRGQFIFRADWHEPGEIGLMGKIYPPAEQLQGEEVLRDLALHPKTAEHLAFKLVLHFLTDEPTPAMVDPVAAAFLASEGDLGVTTRALLDLPEAWSLPLKKLRTPYELALAQFRATGLGLPANDVFWPVTEPLKALVNLPWECGPPDGYPDATAAWLNPDAVRVRLDTALMFTRVFGGKGWPTAEELAHDLFDKALSAPSRLALRKLRGSRSAMVALLMLPEFQRR